MTLGHYVRRASIIIVFAVSPAFAEPFPPGDVTLLDSPFKTAADRNKQYLLSLEPERFMHYFRTEAGLPPRADAYPGWESADEGAGRCLGHYLSALAIQYSADPDPELLDKINAVVDGLAEVQKADGNGYVGAEKDGKKFWADLRAGDPDALKKHRVPWYVQHKMFAGLRDVIPFQPRAKPILIAMGEWASAEVERLDDGATQRMLDQEHGGMVEVLADLYAITSDERFLKLARRFVHHKVIDPLAAGRDELAGLHANTQIPKIIGMARLYELTHDPADRRVAEFFWSTVVDHHTYANGGNSDRERFDRPDRPTLGVDSSETCNTYNMLKLTDHLQAWDAQPRYADYVERALVNHILPSIGPGPGEFTYYVPTKPGHFRTFSRPLESFWCCVGTGMENHGQYNRRIYHHDGGALYVDQFIPSRLNWKQRGVTVEQATDYPASGGIRLTVHAARPTPMVMKLRRPTWADEATLAVNGRPADGGKPGTYAMIERSWSDGDVVEWTLPMKLRTEPLGGDPTTVAIFYGPALLAGRLAEISPGRQLLGDSPHTGGTDAAVPDLPVGDRPVDQWVKRQGDAFRIDIPGIDPISLSPFYEQSNRRYTVYWRMIRAK